MDLKKILCLLAAVAFNTQAFAIEIYKGKLLSHKVTATPGAKTTSAKITYMQQHPSGAKGYFAHTFFKSPMVKVNEAILLGNMHDVYVYNDSNEEHQYQIFMSVCALTDDMSTMHCVRFDDVVSLQSGGYVREDVMPQLTMQYGVAGTYGVDAESGYNEVGKNPEFTFSQANGFVIVS